MKYCEDCGRTGSVWGGLKSQPVCFCGSTNIHPLSDMVIDIEFQSLIETAYTPFDRHVLEALAVANEEDM